MGFPVVGQTPRDRFSIRLRLLPFSKTKCMHNDDQGYVRACVVSLSLSLSLTKSYYHGLTKTSRKQWQRERNKRERNVSLNTRN